MEEGERRPPCDGVEGVNKVARPALLISVVLTSGIHPIDHFIHRIAGLVVAPIPVHQSTKAHGDGAEVVLERGVVRTRRCVFIDDDFRAVLCHPIVNLPGCRIVSCSDER